LVVLLGRKKNIKLTDMNTKQLQELTETTRMMFRLVEENLAYYAREKRFYIRYCSADGEIWHWKVAPSRGRANAINNLLSEKRRWIIENHSQKIFDLAVVYKGRLLWSIASSAQVVK
jgi:hypothetical protein